MRDYYKNCDILTEEEKIVNHYIEGKYFNQVKKQYEVLSDPINKYNKQFLLELNEINKGLFMLEMANGIILRLLGLNSEYSSEEAGIIWRLAKAQSGTIKYNKLLKHALKTYGITKRKLYDRLVYDLDKQKDRIKRNEKLLIDMLKDYNLDELLTLVEDTYGMGIVEHIKAVFGEKTTDITIDMDKADRIEYFECLKDEYIEGLKELARKNGINLDNSISEALLKHRQRLEKERLQIELEKQYKKELDAKTKASKIVKALKDDNKDILMDLENDGTREHVRLAFSSAERIKETLLMYNGVLWYIAVHTGKCVKYVSNKGDLNLSVVNARWFRSEQEAIGYCKKDKTSENSVLGDYYEVFKIDTTSLNDANITYVTQEQLDGLKKNLGNWAISKREYTNILKKTINSAHESGYDLKFCFRMYGVRYPNGGVRLLYIRKNGELKTTDKILSAVKVVPGSGDDIDFKKKIGQYVIENNVEDRIESIDIPFESEWYRTTLIEMDNYMETFIRELVYYHTSYKPLLDLKERLYEYRKQGIETVYCVVISDFNNKTYKRYISFSHTTIYSNGMLGGRKRAGSPDQMDLYVCEADARENINRYINDDTLCCKVYAIPLDKMVFETRI